MLRCIMASMSQLPSSSSSNGKTVSLLVMSGQYLTQLRLAKRFEERFLKECTRKCRIPILMSLFTKIPHALVDNMYPRASNHISPGKLTLHLSRIPVIHVFVCSRIQHFRIRNRTNVILKGVPPGIAEESISTLFPILAGQPQKSIALRIQVKLSQILAKIDQSTLSSQFVKPGVY